MKFEFSILMASLWSIWFVVWTHYLRYIYLTDETTESWLSMVLTFIFIATTILIIFGVLPQVLKEDE